MGFSPEPRWQVRDYVRWVIIFILVVNLVPAIVSPYLFSWLGLL